MGRKNHKMNRNIPIELVAELSNLADRIEQAIRKDERRKVREQLLAGLSETDGQQRGIGQRGKDRRPFRANSPLARVYRCLARRKYGINMQTLVRESGLDQRAVHWICGQASATRCGLGRVRGYDASRYLGRR